MMIAAHDILTEARSWKGTRFHHQGRVKATAIHKGGCDCLGLIVGVARALELKAKDGTLLAGHDNLHYGRFPDGYILKESLEKILISISIIEIKTPDIMLMKFEREPQHVGLVSDYPQGLGLLHCYAAARKVVEHRLDELWQSRIVAAYRFPQLVVD